MIWGWIWRVSVRRLTNRGMRVIVEETPAFPRYQHGRRVYEPTPKEK
jgi:hypothetical protein